MSQLPQNGQRTDILRIQKPTLGGARRDSGEAAPISTAWAAGGLKMKICMSLFSSEWSAGWLCDYSQSGSLTGSAGRERHQKQVSSSRVEDIMIKSVLARWIGARHDGMHSPAAERVIDGSACCSRLLRDPDDDDARVCREELGGASQKGPGGAVWREANLECRNCARHWPRAEHCDIVQLFAFLATRRLRYVFPIFKQMHGTTTIRIKGVKRPAFGNSWSFMWCSAPRAARRVFCP